MSGFLYCFNTFCDPNIYKAGHTQQEELKFRLKSYLGPSKPRIVVASRRVLDSIGGEKMMLGLLRQSSVVKPRRDLGDEWFEACHDHAEEVHKAIRFLFDVVAKAAGEVDPMPTVFAKSLQQHSLTTDATTLPAMGTYFQALDHFINTSSELSSDMEASVTAFETSKECPIFADYVMWPKNIRVAVAANRYPFL